MAHALSTNRTVSYNELPQLAPIASPETNRAVAETAAVGTLRWTWACRDLDRSFQLVPSEAAAARAGDVALVRVDKVGYHGKITTADQARMRLYPGDTLVTVFGNRYATDAYEGRVGFNDELHMLTGAGMVGTVTAKHKNMKAPTQLSLLGFLANEWGQQINLKSLKFKPTKADDAINNIVLLVGTGMNSGKTTAGAKLVKGLLAQGLRVASCKVTGSVSHQDLHEMCSTGAHDARDFSNYGFPSTYLCEQDELIQLFETMVADASKVKPDVIVMEIADGVLQRETQMLLQHAGVLRRVQGVVHTASCSASALFGISQIERCGHRVIAISGVITSSPLFVRELAAQTTIPVCSSVGAGEGLAQQVARFCRISV